MFLAASLRAFEVFEDIRASHVRTTIQCQLQASIYIFPIRKSAQGAQTADIQVRNANVQMLYAINVRGFESGYSGYFEYPDPDPYPDLR